MLIPLANTFTLLTVIESSCGDQAMGEVDRVTILHYTSNASLAYDINVKIITRRVYRGYYNRWDVTRWSLKPIPTWGGGGVVGTVGSRPQGKT